MKLNSLIDPKKRAKVLEAIEKGDGTLLRKNRKKRPSAKPLVEEPKPLDTKPETGNQQPDTDRKQQTGPADSDAIKKAKDVIQRNGIVPGRNLKRIDWSRLSDDEIVRYAKDFMKLHGITSMRELTKGYAGMYTILKKKNLLDKVFK